MYQLSVILLSSSFNAMTALLLLLLPIHVTGRFCEGGHICSLPRECCTQGCCPPYQGGPRQLTPPSEHVLNLFFISHWFFWCVVIAVILAILCAYSLWKKRRTLCGWGFSEHHTQSEGDSAGSCYAPPQYSRCNSFHHPPPPYTEVTSKPDLYPLVFTCNSDNGKGNGSSYLMVQYFRNFIVRPAGSLSAASTVDSLSSSFICNANEANTLVPPPYSRAASPDLGMRYVPSNSLHGSHQQQQHHHHHHHQSVVGQYALQRSASQLVCHNATSVMQLDEQLDGNSTVQSAVPCYQPRLAHAYAKIAHHMNNHQQQPHSHQHQHQHHPHQLQHQHHVNNTSESESGESISSGIGVVVGGVGAQGAAAAAAAPQRHRMLGGGGGTGGASNDFLQSHSSDDQHFRYIANSTSLSDIFVNNSCSGIGGDAESTVTQAAATNGSSLSSLGLATNHGTAVIYSDGCIKSNPLHHLHTNRLQQFISNSNEATSSSDHRRDPVYNSCSSIGAGGSSIDGGGGGTLTIPPLSDDADTDRELHLLRRSLDTCCQLLQQQPALTPPPTVPVEDDTAAVLRSCSYATSGTMSCVSSLANIGGIPGSPPQATSPTGEVRDILDQIRQLQTGVSYEELLLVGGAKSRLHHTLSTPTTTATATSSSKNNNHTINNSMMTRSSPSPSPSQQQQQQPISSCNSLQSMEPMSMSMTNHQQQQQPQRSSLMTMMMMPHKMPATELPSAVNLNHQLLPIQVNSNISQSSSKHSNSNSGTGSGSGSSGSSKKLYTSKPNKTLYIPMVSSGGGGGATSPPPPPPNRCVLKSPVSGVVTGGSSFFVNRGRARMGWISRSAPTTPGTGLPPNRLGDDSPLLNEHDEDEDGEQNIDME